MRIAYVARHGEHGNRDEDAVQHALRRLGHEVVPMPERDGRFADQARADFVLFHHWSDV